METYEIRQKITALLRAKNVGNDFETPDEIKIEILKEVLPDLNLQIGQYINRRNEAGESFNKVIGFHLHWYNNPPHYGGISAYLNLGISIICDRVKRYNPSYSCLHNKPEFFHGEIWGISELLRWRERGDIEECTDKAKEDYEAALETVVRKHNFEPESKMLSW